MSLEVKLPEELRKFILTLIEQKTFSSIEQYLEHSAFLLAELYGYTNAQGGKNISELLVELIVSKINPVSGTQSASIGGKAKPEIPHFDLIMEAFGNSTFMFEDAIYTSIVFSKMKDGEAPISKEEFHKSMNLMKEQDILTKLDKDGKIMWKKV